MDAESMVRAFYVMSGGPGDDRRFGSIKRQESQFAEGALEDSDLRHRIPGDLEFRTDLGFEVTGVPDFVDEEFEEALGGQQGLGFQFIESLIAHRHIATADVEDDVVMAVSPESFEP